MFYEYECFDCMYVLHVCHAREGQKRPLDTLELKLHRVVSCHVGAGT